MIDPRTYTWSDNVGIAYGTVIENVLGGAATDTLLGNDAGNYLSGGGGNDFLRGFLGYNQQTYMEQSGSSAPVLDTP